MMKMKKYKGKVMIAKDLLDAARLILKEIRKKI